MPDEKDEQESDTPSTLEVLTGGSDTDPEPSDEEGGD
jgi:hypothetical protein